MTHPTEKDAPYAEGDRVEVYDGDRGRWCPGVVQSVWNKVEFFAPPALSSRIMVVRSDDEFEGDLPLMWGVPIEAVSTLVRVIPPAKGDSADKAVEAMSTNETPTDWLVYCSAHRHYLVFASGTGTTWTGDQAEARRYENKVLARKAAEKATWLDHNPTPWAVAATSATIDGSVER